MSFIYKKDYQGGEGEVAVGRLVTTGIVVVGIIFLSSLAWGPIYTVWSSGMAGKAELAQAEYNRQIKVREAQALYDSAELTAKAEVRRAEGVAQANTIVANGLGGPEGYLRYLYIHMLEGQQQQIIYIPTEAGLPILEARNR